MASHIVCLSLDFDMPRGLLGADGVMPLSCGEDGAGALARMLALLRSRGLHTTWFMPAETIDGYRKPCDLVMEGGHEIALRGVSLMLPAAADRAKAELQRGNAAIQRFTGHKTRGYRAPHGELAGPMIDLLLAEEFTYDSSRSAFDYAPYRVRRNRSGRPADARKPGAETPLIEMPVGWAFKDYSRFVLARTDQVALPTLNTTRSVLDTWLEEFRRMKQVMDWGILTYTMHPYVIGPVDNMLAFEAFLTRLLDEGAAVMTMTEAAQAAEAQMLPLGYVQDDRLDRPAGLGRKRGA